MAEWKASVSRFAQNAVSKSKEVAEITRINMEISNIEQKIKKAQRELGAYVLEHPEVVNVQDETISALLAEAAEGGEELAKQKQTLMDVRNVNICDSCGAEVSRTSKFCGKCGAPMDRSVLETSEATNTCPDCGAPLEEGMAFCANCGKKLGE